MGTCKTFKRLEERPFKYIGIDYCGNVCSKIASQTEKNHIALVSCAAIRMMHLEFVTDVSTTLLVRCLKRFVGRSGLPKLMLSDNGKTFIADQLKAFNTRNEIA